MTAVEVLSMDRGTLSNSTCQNVFIYYFSFDFDRHRPWQIVFTWIISECRKRS